MPFRNADYWLRKSPVLLESMGAQVGISARDVAEELAKRAANSPAPDDVLIKGFVTEWIVTED
jgi:hypothetical protein